METPGLRPTELAYFAGFLDGEGCFRWKGSGVAVSVSNTYPWILHCFKKFWGGSIRKLHKAKMHHRRAYEWEVCGAKAVAVAAAVGPFLREKREQALLLEMIHESKPGARRGALVSALRVFKKVEHHDGA